MHACSKTVNRIYDAYIFRMTPHTYVTFVISLREIHRNILSYLVLSTTARLITARILDERR